MNVQYIHMNNSKNQQGAVLLIGLILLFILTVVGTSGITTVTMEEKMVSNMQDDTRAYQGAETALANCEKFIFQADFNALEPTNNTTFNEVWAFNALINQWAGTGYTYWWQDSDLWKNSAVTFAEIDLTANTDGLHDAPKCFREYVGKTGGGGEFDELARNESLSTKRVYRITAQSYGVTNDAETVLQSFYIKQ